MKVSFGTTIVQKNRRIAIDPNLLENMGLAEGDAIRLFFDTDINAIVIEKSGANGHSDGPLVKNP